MKDNEKLEKKIKMREIIETLCILYQDYLAEIDTYDGAGSFWSSERVGKYEKELTTLYTEEIAKAKEEAVEDFCRHLKNLFGGMEYVINPTNPTQMDMIIEDYLSQPTKEGKEE